MWVWELPRERNRTLPMNINSTVRLVVVMAFAIWPSTGLAQDVWPGIAVEYGTTGMGSERIIYGNGQFLVSTAVLFAPPGGTSATSPDGFHWTVHRRTNSVILGGFRRLATGSNNFVAWGFDSAISNGLIQFSADGEVWGEPLTIPSTPLKGGAYANGIYVAVGQNGGTAAVVTSHDGVNWNTQTFPGYERLNAIATSGTTFVAVGKPGAVLTSANGTDWLTQTVLPGADILGVTYGQGMFMAGAFPSGFLTSADGTNWVIRSWPLTWEIAYGNGLFVAISNDIDVSTNGVDWVRIWNHPGAELDLVGVAYGAGMFNVLIEGGNLITISPRALLGFSAETNGVMNLTMTGGWLGQSCRLQATTNLSASNWVDLFTFTNQGSVTYLQDPSATNYSQRFYRVAMP
jgi:hypothetical protein